MRQERSPNERSSGEPNGGKRPLRRGTPLPLRKGLERLNLKYAKTLEKLAR